ncbi:phosphotransferase family protein [Rhodovibrionaceae bacterium A322]
MVTQNTGSDGKTGPCQWGTVPVLPQHLFDEAALWRYLQAQLPDNGLPSGSLDPDSCEVRQFQGGQSNPTFLLNLGQQQFVLRKKPPGQLLPKAHMVEREFQVMQALAGTDVPVPAMVLLCEDPSVIGTPFFVMEFRPGRICSDPRLSELPKSQRRDLYREMIEGLAHLHKVDWRACGLETFGRPENFVARQVAIWSRQYEATKSGDLPEMDKLAAWLQAHIPEAASDGIVHGDYRVGNMILHLEQPKVLALLDWELSTIGDPLADLGYFLMPFELSAHDRKNRGLRGLDLDAAGLPDKAELCAAYCTAAGRDSDFNLDYYIALALFRLTAIVQGVYARALQGNAADAGALEVGKRARSLAEAGWRLAQQNGA